MIYIVNFNSFTINKQIFLVKILFSNHIYNNEFLNIYFITSILFNCLKNFIES